MVHKATVAAMICVYEETKKKEENEKNAMKVALIDELRGVISSQIALAIGGGQKRLLKAGANTNVSSTNTAEGHEAVSESCAMSLLEKFNSMGTKAKENFG